MGLYQGNIPLVSANDNLFIAQYGVTTSEEIENAYQSGKLVWCIYDESIYILNYRKKSNRHYFASADSGSFLSIEVYNNEWSVTEEYYAARNHASTHSSDGADPITPDMIGAVTQSYVDIRVPAWVSADEGKILSVVDGNPAWKTVTIESSNPIIMSETQPINQSTGDFWYKVI